MARIICKGCYEDISDWATVCPYCRASVKGKTKVVFKFVTAIILVPITIILIVTAI